jgi:hypothetical protein
MMEFSGIQRYGEGKIFYQMLVFILITPESASTGVNITGRGAYDDYPPSR